MKRSIVGIISGLVLTMLAFAPMPTHASNATFFGPIVPAECHCDSQTIQGGGGTVNSAPDYGCVLQVVENVINFGVTLSTIIFTIYLVITGFSFITSAGSSEARSRAKTRFMNVFVGLLVLLCAWLIVDFVMKTIYNQGKFGPWNGILAGNSAGTDRCIVPNKPKAITLGSVVSGITTVQPGTAPGVPGTGVTTADRLSDADTRARLAAAGVTIARGFPAASSLANTRTDTINQIINIKQACGCNVQVNATTGGSHSSGTYSHAGGYKVDLQPNQALDSFLRSLTSAGTRSDKATLYTDSCGNQYAREATHWDITVNKGSCTLGH